MDRGLYIAASTTSALMNKQALISQNMANVSTPGFKKLFEQQITWNMPEGKEGEYATRVYSPEITPGVDTSAGVALKTDDPLNILIPEGFYLGINAADGPAVTKRGDLVRDENGILRTGSGQEVQAQGGGNIVLPENAKAEITKEGLVIAMDPANPLNRTEVGRIQIVAASPNQIQLRPDGLLSATGGVEVTEGFALKSGMIEQSNATMTEALTNMINTSRLYDFNTKVVSAFSAKDQKGTEIIANWR